MKKIILIITLICLKVIMLKAQTDTNIAFYDYDPDFLFDNNYDTVKIDINQDGVMDIKFNIGLYPYPSMRTTSLNGNICKYVYIPNSYNDSLKNPLLYWRTDESMWNWSWNIERIGIKFTIGTDIYYGWLHGIVFYNDVTSMSNLIIDKYAFCKIANYPFLWGQTEIITGMNMLNNSDSTSVFIDSSGNLKVESNKSIANVTITSLQGAVVASQSNINSNNASISTAGFAQGSYIVQVVFEDGSVLTRQIVL